MARPILLDVDTGTDDALAILYAVRHPDLEILGISCVAGNSGVDQVVTNTLKILDAAGARSDIPVARGAAQPLVGLAPQTNLALLLTLHPEVLGNVERVLFMGGSASLGNVTAVAEFNVWQD